MKIKHLILNFLEWPKRTVKSVRGVPMVNGYICLKNGVSFCFDCEAVARNYAAVTFPETSSEHHHFFKCDNCDSWHFKVVK